MTTGLTAKEKTLVGIGAAIASGCQPCTAKYVQAARAAGACERSIRLAIETAVAERQKATDKMAEWAQNVQGTIPALDDSFRSEKRKNTALIASVAAHAVRSTATLDANLSHAMELGWSLAQLGEALDVGRNVTKVAAEKVDAIVADMGLAGANVGLSCCEEPGERLAAPAANSSGCGCASGRSNP